MIIFYSKKFVLYCIKSVSKRVFDFIDWRIIICNLYILLVRYTHYTIKKYKFVSLYIPSSYLCQKLTNFRSLLVYYSKYCYLHGLDTISLWCKGLALGGITIDLIRAHVLRVLVLCSLSFGSYIPILLSSFSQRM